MNTPVIGFLGFGNMAQALARGLVKHANYPSEHLCACAAHYDKLQKSTSQLGIHACTTATELTEMSDYLIVAVKPHQIEDLIAPLIDNLTNKVIISVAAGWLFDDFERILPANAHHLSTIPNIPVEVGAGVIACEKTHSLSAEEFECFREIFAPIALVEVVPGELLSTASAVAGCGPAFAALFMEALADAAVKQGMPRETAYRLAAQMLKGSGELCVQTSLLPAELKDAVCSPGGTTIRGVTALEKEGFRAAIIAALEATLRPAPKQEID